MMIPRLSHRATEPVFSSEMADLACFVGQLELSGDLRTAQLRAPINKI